MVQTVAGLHDDASMVRFVQRGRKHASLELLLSLLSTRSCVGLNLKPCMWLCVCCCWVPGCGWRSLVAAVTCRFATKRRRSMAWASSCTSESNTRTPPGCTRTPSDSYGV